MCQRFNVMGNPAHRWQRLYVRTPRALLMRVAPQNVLLGFGNLGAADSGQFHPPCVSALLECASRPMLDSWCKQGCRLATF